ncbi:MAG: TolC family protein [Saprospiraceae bacterium]
MLPSITLKANDAVELGYLYQKYFSGVIGNYPFLASNAINIGAYIDWTIYNAGISKLNKEKLEQIVNISDINLKKQILTTIYEVSNSYYDIVRQKQQLEYYNEIINYNIEREKITKAKFNSGNVPKTELLQSTIDLNISRKTLSIRNM